MAATAPVIIYARPSVISAAAAALAEYGFASLAEISASANKDTSPQGVELK